MENLRGRRPLIGAAVTAKSNPDRECEESYDEHGARGHGSDAKRSRE